MGRKNRTESGHFYTVANITYTSLIKATMHFMDFNFMRQDIIMAKIHSERGIYSVLNRKALHSQH